MSPAEELILEAEASLRKPHVPVCSIPVFLGRDTGHGYLMWRPAPSYRQWHIYVETPTENMKLLSAPSKIRTLCLEFIPKLKAAAVQKYAKVSKSNKPGRK